MRQQPFASLLILSFLTGCAASAYNLSGEALKFRASLTDTEALNVVKKMTEKNNDQAGVCSAHTNEQFQPAEPVTVKDPNLVFNSFYKATTGVSSAVGSGSVTTTMSYQMRKGEFQTNLRNLNKIRVLAGVRGSGCAGAPQSGYIVMIDNAGVGDVAEGRANAVMINVSTKNLDQLLAALTLLSPNARVIQGSGL